MLVKFLYQRTLKDFVCYKWYFQGKQDKRQNPLTTESVYPCSTDLVISPVSGHFWNDVGSGPLRAERHRRDMRREKLYPRNDSPRLIWPKSVLKRLHITDIFFFWTHLLSFPPRTARHSLIGGGDDHKQTIANCWTFFARLFHLIFNKMRLLWEVLQERKST